MSPDQDASDRVVLGKQSDGPEFKLQLCCFLVVQPFQAGDFIFLSCGSPTFELGTKINNVRFIGAFHKMTPPMLDSSSHGKYYDLLLLLLLFLIIILVIAKYHPHLICLPCISGYLILFRSVLLPKIT